MTEEDWRTPEEGGPHRATRNEGMIVVIVVLLAMIAVGISASRTAWCRFVEACPTHGESM